MLTRAAESSARPESTEQAATMQLTAQIEPFDSFWEGPEDVESGYRKLSMFYRRNYLRYLPSPRESQILVISCGPGYFVNMLLEQGYKHVTGIDSFESKIAYARHRGLDCRVMHAFPFLIGHKEAFDAIVCEQEINHLAKEEILIFLRLARESLVPGGTLIVHALNGANPITGSEALAQNFDHYNTFTEYSLRQLLEYSAFTQIHVFGLNLYVFYKNPFNYVAWAASALFTALFRIFFILYGKSNKIFTKKIAAVCIRPNN